MTGGSSDDWSDDEGDGEWSDSEGDEGWSGNGSDKGWIGEGGWCCGRPWWHEVIFLNFYNSFSIEKNDVV
jgi:hypothetical protein